jgi:hypothetical protein
MLEKTIVLLIIALNCYIAYGKPEQIHLSLGANPTEMVVTWTTFTKAKSSTVNYNKIGGQMHSAETVTTHFLDKDYEAYIHRALLTGLEPGLSYEYRCESDGKYSEVFKFKAISDNSNFSPRLAVYGDLGHENGVSIPQLITDVKNGLYDAILHIGDIAYNLNKNSGTVGDMFMNEIQPIAAHVPYQVCPGNHEDKRNFTHYLNRFTMIDTHSGHVNNHFYSFDLGSAHFIAFSTELYFWPEFFTQSHIQWQYEWLENDLKVATKPENRAKRPWIITLGHRPMYCLKDNDKDCFSGETLIRKGRSGTPLQIHTTYGLEELFMKYGVDIEFYGHEHLYERSYPIYDYHVYNISSPHLYTNAKAPIHIISGAAGTTDRPDFMTSLPKSTAFYAPDYGFTRMTINNKTHITIQQISVEKETKVLDSFVIEKDLH